MKRGIQTMKDKKEKLKNAIINNDMEEIRAFYEYIFMEEAPRPKVFDNQSLKRIIDEAVLILTSANDQAEEEKEEPYKPAESVVKKDKNGVVFISSDEFELPEDSIQGYKEFMEKQKKRTKVKDKRPSYIPNTKKCASCSTEFDFNKEYPAGLLESGTNAKLKCNRCRSSS